MQTITLPMPPSLNRYYRAVGNMVKISAEGRAYRQAVRDEIINQQIEPVGKGRVWLHVLVERADERRADLDNTGKALLDALEGDAKEKWPGAYDNDGQIDLLIFERGEKSKAPKVTVTFGLLPERNWMGRVLGAIRRIVFGLPSLVVQAA